MNDTMSVYKTLCDLVAKASVVDTVIGRPRVLYEKLVALRDQFGAMTQPQGDPACPVVAYEWVEPRNDGVRVVGAEPRDHEITTGLEPLIRQRDHLAAMAAKEEVAERDALRADAEALRCELGNIANAKRFDRGVFADDTEFADWAQSRARRQFSGSAKAATKETTK